MLYGALVVTLWACTAPYKLSHYYYYYYYYYYYFYYYYRYVACFFFCLTTVGKYAFPSLP